MGALRQNGRRDIKAYPVRQPEKTFGHGVLHAEVYRARNIKGDELAGHGSADPYLKIINGTAIKKVSLESTVHQDGGSEPVWNYHFCFPFRNGGLKEHNVLDIEIWNANHHTSLFRKDNLLGHLRIGGLAEYVTKHRNSVTEAMWYPVFYKRRSRDCSGPVAQRGEILVKFYFQNVREEVFASGHHTEPLCSEITLSTDPAMNADNFGRAQFQLVECGKMVRCMVGLTAL